ncbi:MFS transporter [Rhodococcus opacus]|uniref:MFS transporter n=1 Tax=Rhodococcus opacus TaxID=37919 RepID=A0AAX3YR06_RHOOP|nr:MULTISPECIES: MFS transporter [Rhodococcus]MCZ4586153.1 MFS transporter [Rhodococcus opacus]QSE86059.1 MFS transporter [Rhodococcus koreensis]WLF51912.1 MFS transporter [Rhodococcus opacus]
MTPTTTDSVTPLSTSEQQRKAKRATAVAAFGTLIEYYDFSVYGYVAATLAVVFFPSDDPMIGLLNTLLVFGSAFAVRPLGALCFGWLGDRVGRRASLMASIGLMSVAAALTGMLPGYAQIGVAAPILLVVFRMLQGFSSGGEIGGAVSYIREWAEPHRRPLYISLVPSLGVLGKGAAAGIAALSASFLPSEAMEAWGWRIPFLLAVPLGILCLYMRLSIEDSPEYTASKADNTTTTRPFKLLLAHHRAPLAKVVVIAVVQNTGVYLGTVFVAVYFSNILGFSKGQAATIVLLAVVAAAMFIPAAGLLGCRVGAKKLLTISYIVYAVVTIPSFLLMGQHSVTLAVIGLVIGMVPYALCSAGTLTMLPEMFPVQVRHTGVAFGHSVGAVLGGGLSPFVATWLIDVTGNNLAPAYILTGSGILGIAIVLGAVRNTTTDAHLYR